MSGQMTDASNMTGQTGRGYVTGDEVFGSRNEKNAPSKHDSTTARLSWWTRGHRKVQARHEERTSYYEVATMLIDGHRQIENDLYV